MSYVEDLLREKKTALLSQVAETRRAIKDIDAALQALGLSDNPRQTEVAVYSDPLGGSQINAAIVEAVRNGSDTPIAIFDYITNKLGVETTKSSVSTRLSKLKNEGILDNSGDGWIVSQKHEGPAEAGPVVNGDGDGSRGSASHPAPAGSTPVVSTDSHQVHVRFSRDLDDEIPF